ncbi:MAG: single-stranded DNA-binding protein [Microcoleaceae cyanobacterium]
MNSCILMVEILQEPQLRYTADNQTPIAEMMVQFSGLRATDPPGTLKVVGWGSLAQEISATYHQGDQVVIEGRLGMNMVERPEGFKEKRAELTVQKIYPLGTVTPSSTMTGSTMTAVPSESMESSYSTPDYSSPSNVVPLSSRSRGPAEPTPLAQPTPAAQPLNPNFDEPEDPDYDPIPF